MMWNFKCGRDHRIEDCRIGRISIYRPAIGQENVTSLSSCLFIHKMKIISFTS